MYAFIVIGIIGLKFIYIFMKLIPTKNKIVFISRQNDNPSIDFRMIRDEIEKNYSDIKIVFVTKKMEKNLKSILKNFKFILIQMYHLATSKVCITDGYNIPVSVLNHKKNLKIIQIWHSLSAIKKFGYQTLDTQKKKKIAQILCMHKNYDYLISGSKAMVKYFSKSFNYNKDKFYSLGLPRIDYLIKYNDVNKTKVYKRYPNFKDKKIILYVPTFRENDNYKINELIKSVDLQKYILIIKVHPNMNYSIKKKKNVYICKDFSSLQLLSVADYVITDYSAISVEAAVLNKPIYIYAYDLEEYSKYPGINIDLQKYFPKLVFKDANDLFRILDKEKYNLEIVQKYKNKFVVKTDGNITKDITKFIIKVGGFDDKKN